MSHTEKLLSFIEKSPTAFHAVAEIGAMLDSAGFARLSEGSRWDIVRGGKYYVTRNGSSVIAFAVPEEGDAFTVTASHTDSPTYKIKNTAEADACGKYKKLLVEQYGGMIASTWMDRPLSVAGRLIVKTGGRLESRLVKVDRDLVLIPNVAIHMNRNINTGYNFNAAVDMLPLFSEKATDKSLRDVVAEAAGVDRESILSSDLYLYNRTPASIWGAGMEFFSAPRIDNLQCAYSTLQGLIEATVENSHKSIAVYFASDNEEVGSDTKQGAGSHFLSDVLTRICDCLGLRMTESLPSSFMVSADNAHAKHPNHPELSDPVNSPAMNEGIVIKSNASQLYTTDALSQAIFSEICARAGVPVQYFANRSDMRGGSTLGSISNTLVALPTVDIGLAQLAMHSSYETAGCRDTEHLVKASRQLYSSRLISDGNGTFEIE